MTSIYTMFLYYLALFNISGFMNPQEQWCNDTGTGSDNICCTNTTYIANLTCPTRHTCDKIILTPYLKSSVVLDAVPSTGTLDMYDSFLKDGTSIGLPKNINMLIFVAKTGDSTMQYTLGNQSCFKLYERF